MYLCGSQALNYWSFHPFDESKNYDIIASEEELNIHDLSFSGKDQFKHGKIEFIDIKLLNNEKLCRSPYKSYRSVDVENFNCVVLRPTALYIMKRSHLFRPLKFAWHIQQFQKLKTHECPLFKDDLTTLRERISLTKKKYGDKVPKLNKTNEEFFDDSVTKYYVHDDIHKIVSYDYGHPIYERLKLRKELAMCEKDLWYKLPHQDKVNCVREEGYVIALERFIIPKIESGEKHMSPEMAFDKALEKICTTLCSGYFRDFAIDNWQEIRSNIACYLIAFLSQKNNLERLK
jgi:hypothetical protein